MGLATWARSWDGLDTRLGASGSLVSGAQTLVFDEPTQHVDPAMATELMDQLVLTARQAGRHSVVVMTHLPVRDDLVDHHVTVRAAG